MPKISLTVPSILRDMDLSRMDLAIEITSSKERLPLCFTFLTFFRSLGGSLRALIIKEAADGHTEMAA